MQYLVASGRATATSELNVSSSKLENRCNANSSMKPTIASGNLMKKMLQCVLADYCVYFLHQFILSLIERGGVRRFKRPIIRPQVVQIQNHFYNHL